MCGTSDRVQRQRTGGNIRNGNRSRNICHGEYHGNVCACEYHGRHLLSYYSGKSKIIRSPEELEEFGDFCERPEEVAEYGSNVDFDKNVVAVNMVFLSSGSYDFEFFNTYVTEGTVNFEYDLIEYDAMTCDIATLYMFAEIPAELISDPYPGETAEKYNDNILSFEIVRFIDDDMYKTSIIRSSDELSEFARAYGVSEDIGDFGDGIDFEKNVIAAQVVLLSCGGRDTGGADISGGICGEIQ